MYDRGAPTAGGGYSSLGVYGGASPAYDRVGRSADPWTAGGPPSYGGGGSYGGGSYGGGSYGGGSYGGGGGTYGGGGGTYGGGGGTYGGGGGGNPWATQPSSDPWASRGAYSDEFGSTPVWFRSSCVCISERGPS